jgi:hypothetical protein
MGRAMLDTRAASSEHGRRRGASGGRGAVMRYDLSQKPAVLHCTLRRMHACKDDETAEHYGQSLMILPRARFTRHDGRGMFGNFPEKRGSMGETRSHKSLKRQKPSSTPFPKKAFLGSVCLSSSH